MAGYAIINLEAKPVRLLTREQAASYCNLPVSRFVLICPVTPVEINDRIRLWDIHDLDGWIDTLKSGYLTDSEIIERLP